MLVASARRGKLTALVALARRDTNRGAVAVNSPGMSEAIPRGIGSLVGLFILPRRGCGKTKSFARYDIAVK
jgi:hypothetical protein